MQKPTVYFLIGPTAVGKTAVSISLAKLMGAEIISADSIQVYKGLDIGSAKPSLIEQDGIAHHLVDICEVNDKDFSVSKYRRLAQECITDILKRGKKPLVVGGTGLYIESLVQPLHFANIKGSDEVRQRLIAIEERQPGALHKKLQAEDEASAKRIHPNDIKRIVRALEVLEITGKTMTSFGNNFSNPGTEDESSLPYNICMAGLTMERQKLYDRIECRIDGMIEQGLLNEVETLYKAQYDRNLPALQGLGYRQLIDYLYGDTTYEDAIELLKRDTRRFAKRQNTWFKRYNGAYWLDITNEHDYTAAAQMIYEYYIANSRE